MPGPRRAGRPLASSRAMLEEAAGELFLERGYAATSVADVTQRAGVSRSTFFNYFETKSDLLWAAFDDAVRTLAARLEAGTAPGEATGEAAVSAGAQAYAGLRELAAGLPADHVALAFTQAEAMGLGPELRVAAARRTADVGDVLTEHARAHGVPPLAARVAGTAWAGALVAAVEAWARAGADRTALATLLDEALVPVRSALP
ncbi:MAG TPA: TetR/AcrR family transcriptional regulator [Cellulomonas sp.]